MLFDLSNLNDYVRFLLIAVTAFSFSSALGNKVIDFFCLKQLGQVVRYDGPKAHLKKQGTPTMGGLLIIGAILFSVFLFGDITNLYLSCLILTLLAFAVLGFVDDWLKIIDNNSNGLSAKAKFFWQFLIACGIMLLLSNNNLLINYQYFAIPFIGKFYLGLGLIPFGVLVIVSTSNAVNLTDGLDGLVILPVILVACGLGIFAYCSGSDNFTNEFVPNIKNIREVCVFCAALFGAGLGFLWFNSYPAQLFMGDVGSLSLGACLGVLAVVIKQEFVLIIMGFVFVVEAFSVILQVLVYKLKKIRLFKMSPLHHHFELQGVHEVKIVIRMWILTLLLVLMSLSLLYV